MREAVVQFGHGAWAPPPKIGVQHTNHAATMHTRHGGGRAWLENVIWLVKVQVGRDRVEQVGDCVG